MCTKFNFSSLTGIVIFALAALAAASCTDVKESKPEVKITPAECTATSVSFTIETVNAASAAYLLLDDPSKIPSPGVLVANGTTVPAETAEYSIEGLLPEKKYTVAAVAKDDAGTYSDVVTLELSTSPVTKVTFEITLGEPTSKSVPLKIVPSDETARYYVAVMDASEAASLDDDSMYAMFMEDFNAEAQKRGKTLQEYMDDVLSQGVFDMDLAPLDPVSDYTLIVFSLDMSAGYLTSDIYREDFSTTEDKGLSFTLKVENIQATKASVSVLPSNAVDTFVWLCQPTSTYPGMDADEIAEAYIEQNKQWLDSHMGLYTGNQIYEEYELMPGTDYYLVAFGYAGGLNSDVYSEFFSSLPGSDPETFSCEIEFTDIQAEMVNFKVTPADETIYYLYGAVEKSTYDRETARQQVEQAIQEYLEGQQSWNPGYTVEQAVESMCSRGPAEDYFSPLVGGTEYMMYVVPVSNKGVAAQNVTEKEFKTADASYSDAYVTSEFLGAFDGVALQEQGYFTESFLNDKIVMVYDLICPESANEVRYKLWYGFTDVTDSELLGFIGEYWDGTRTKEDLDAGRTRVFITNMYYNSTTFITLGVDADNNNARLGRNPVDAIAEGETRPVEEFAELYGE